MTPAVKLNEPLELPAWWTEADAIKPPCFGEVSVFLDKEAMPSHPMVLWKARIFDRVYIAYRPDCKASFKHGFRIDRDGPAPTTYPNRWQFERALLASQDAAMDHNAALEKWDLCIRKEGAAS